MKKIIPPLTGLAIAISAGSSVVSCIRAAYNQGLVGERIALITDSGRVTDKSFNQQMYEALKIYSDRPFIKDEGQGGFNFAERGLSARTNYVQPLKTDYADFVSAYKLAKIKGTDMLILSGFQHAATIPVASRVLGPETSIIFVDSADNNQYNVINLIYNSQLAGFAAAYDTAVWATKVIPDGDSNWHYQGFLNDPHKISFGLFGGISSKLAVDNYLWGMMVAIQYFNKNAGEAAADPISQQKPFINFANIGKYGDISELKPIEGSNQTYFSGSFEPGGATKAGIPGFLVDNKADVIFPVAGPQTLDVLSYNNTVRLIGVDNDQSLQYPSYAKRFVTSATKAIKTSLYDAFDHSKNNRLNRLPDGTLAPKPLVPLDGGDYWDGTVVTPKPGWSVSLSHTDYIPSTLLPWGTDPSLKDFSQILVDVFANTGPSTTDYFNIDVINNAVEQLLANRHLPLEFPTKNENKKEAF